MKKVIITVTLLLFTVTSFAQQAIQYKLCGQDFSPIYIHSNLPKNAVYTDTAASPAARAKDVLSRLSFDEKLMLTGGWNSMYFPGVGRLGLRPIHFSDASQGIHLKQFGVKQICMESDKSTAFPSEQALAATWDPDLAYRYAKSIGEECRGWGIDVLLGPGLNMYRNSEGGRNFEYMGEDPFLTSAMGVQYVKGLQSTGTMATLKHFIGNEQEFARHIINVKIGEAALREIYLRPFLAAINQGGALAIMTGNNFVNGYPGAADKPISENILRREYGYKGVIMSDWANSMFWRDRQNLVIGSGQSLLMSDNKIFANYIQNELKAHPEKKSIIEKGLDSMVFYNLYAFFKMGFYDHPYRDPALVLRIENHKRIALKTAEEAITLLKNQDNILPLDKHDLNRIVVLGTAEALHAFTGKGSGNVTGYDQTDYLTGLKDIYGNKIIRSKEISDDGIRSADAVLYFISKHAGEGSDDPFDLPDSINNDIIRCSGLNKNIVVIYSGGNGFSMPWLSRVKGVVFAYLLGQESGIALANIISGQVNPSGKLPFTIEKDFKDSPAFDYNKMSDGKYYWGGGKGIERKYSDQFGHLELQYKEGIYIGYRWYDKKQIKPQFPFGFGLSYTTFKISDIKASSDKFLKNNPVVISFNISNTGKLAGAQTAQLYIHPVNNTTDRPIKELKGFKKVFLAPGESKRVQIPIDLQDISFWNNKTKRWSTAPGSYSIEIGPSSNEIAQKITISNSF